MKTSQRIALTAIALAYSWSSGSVCAATTSATGNKEGGGEQYLSLIGNAHVQYHPTFFNDVERILHQVGVRKNKKKKRASTRKLAKKGKNSKNTSAPTKNPTKNPTKAPTKDTTIAPTIAPTPDPGGRGDDCDPADVKLLDYPQWEAEKGYWIGEYTFLQGDGNPYESSQWNYPYDHYKGFITGEVVGNAYRQRNVFLYPPQIPSKCNPENEKNVIGDGECGVNGNTKVFEADQSATTCSLNPALGGIIEGLYVQGPYELPTKTELIGRENALLYQVFIPGTMVGKEEDVLLQSQLTTITKNEDKVYRTRTAQSFDTFVSPGLTTSASYYRERRVSKEEFYESLNSSIADYNIRTEDLCVWDNSGFPVEGVTGSIEACEEHLEESFLLGSEE